MSKQKSTTFYQSWQDRIAIAVRWYVVVGVTICLMYMCKQLFFPMGVLA